MKIVWLNGNPNPNFGGTEIHSVQMVKDLQKRDVEVILVVAKGSYVDRNTQGIKKYHISFPNSLAFINTLKLARVLKREKPCLLIANNGKEYVNALIAGKISKVKVAFFRHMERMREWTVRKFVFPYVDFFFAVSEHVKKNLVMEGVNPEKIEVIYNTVDQGKFYWREKPKDVINILFVGKLDEGKGVFDLFTALTMLLKEGKTIKGIFVGDGKAKKDLETLIRKENLEDRIILTGYVKDVEKYYQISHVCVIPSKEREAFGRVALEALACGCSLVVSNIGGIKEAVVEGYNGYVFEAGNREDLYKKLLKALESWERLSKNSLILFRERFSKEKIMEDFIITLQRICSM